MKDKSVKIEISVSDENAEGSITMPTTVATTDVTKPLIINTKFATSPPGPSSESTDTASEVRKIMYFLWLSFNKSYFSLHQTVLV